jgi:formylglycine-generating enzyme
VLILSGAPVHALEMVLVEGGTFMMASDAEDQYAPQPIHRVTLDSFYMSKYEVTIEKWRQFVQDSGIDFDWERNSRGVSPVSQDSPCERCPILNVSWYQAVQFCNWLSEQEGLTPCYSRSGPEITCDFSASGYRLPTEAEWEYAARGGNKSQGYRFSGSDDVDAVGWYQKNSGEKILERTAQAVGEKAPNEIGLHDMSGNVYEWCWNWYGDFSTEPQENPTGPPSGIGRVTHGAAGKVAPSTCSGPIAAYLNLIYGTMSDSVRYEMLSRFTDTNVRKTMIIHIDGRHTCEVEPIILMNISTRNHVCQASRLIYQTYGTFGVHGRTIMKNTITHIILVVAFLASILPGIAFSDEYWPDQDWRTSTPEEQGIDSAMIADMLEHIAQQRIDIHSFLLIRNGYLVTEVYVNPYSPEIPHQLYSCTKSIISALTGIARADGYIGGVDQKMLDFFGDIRIKHPDVERQEITLAHLLTMTSGLQPKPSFPLYQYAEPIPFVVNLPMMSSPGEEFAYNSAAVHLLSAIIRQTTGTDVLSYAQKKLFTPLGISEVVWEADSTGLQFGPTGLRLTPRTLAKLICTCKTGSGTVSRLFPKSGLSNRRSATPIPPAR